MGNHSDQARQQQLAQQQAEDRARQQALMTQANTPTPLETAQNNQSLDWLNATSGKNGPLDVTSLSAMKPYLNLYDNAANRQNQSRVGTGALRLGQMGDGSGLSSLLMQQSADERQQNAAGNLENAYRTTDATMRGNIMPLLGLQQTRSMGLASLASGNSNNSTNQYANFRPATPFWQSLLMGGLGAAGSAVKYTVP